MSENEPSQISVRSSFERIEIVQLSLGQRRSKFCPVDRRFADSCGHFRSKKTMNLEKKETKLKENLEKMKQKKGEEKPKQNTQHRSHHERTRPISGKFSPLKMQNNFWKVSH